jgi:CDP-diacylglycerol--glycerol-3-phosphate 3-phosphatidyltransferase
MNRQGMRGSFHRLFDRFASGIAATGIPAGFFTSFSVILYLAACVLFARGRFSAAGLAIAAAGACDLLDGPVARRQRRYTLFFIFLDSVLDRYADLIVFVGLLIYFARINDFLYSILVGVAMAGSVLVSYAQARAESLIPSCTVGFWKRPQRVLVLIAAALINSLDIVNNLFIMKCAIWLLAIGANITVLHRILYTWRRTSTAATDAREMPSGSGLSSPRRA